MQSFDHSMRNVISARPRAFTMFLALGCFIIMAEPAFAQAQQSALFYVLCNVVSFFMGNIGRGLATLAVIALGVGALFGKVSWGLAVTVGVGIGAMFGAPLIITGLLLNTGVNPATCPV